MNLFKFPIKYIFYKFIIDIINKIPNDLIFKDYIIYYLQKYINPQSIYNKDDTYHKLIELLLKIIWIESNINYILKIIKIFEEATQIFNNNDKKLYNKIDELIFKEKNIKYITNEKKPRTYKRSQ